MTPENFVYWLQGFLEIAGPKEITPEQVEIIKKHMALVLTNVTSPGAGGTVIIRGGLSNPYDPGVTLC